MGRGLGATAENARRGHKAAAAALTPVARLPGGSDGMAAPSRRATAPSRRTRIAPEVASARWATSPRP